MKHIYPQLSEGNGVSIYGAYIGRLMDPVKYANVDAAHFELGYTGVAEFWQAYAAMRAKKLYILTLHDPPVVVRRPFERYLSSRNPIVKAVRKSLDLTLGRRLIKQVVRNARGIIILNAQAKRLLVKDFGLVEEQIWVLPNPILLPPIKTVREQNTARLLFFGNIAKQKGVDTLVEAFTEVRRQKPETQLIIAGAFGDNVAYRQKIEQMVADSPAQAAITITGRLSDETLMAELAACTTVILPYLDQGVIHASGPLMLALAAGKPVIASDIPVFHDEITDSRGGLLVPPGDPAELAKQVLALLDDEKLRVELGKNGQAHLAREHSDAVIRQKLAKIYTSL